MGYVTAEASSTNINIMLAIDISCKGKLSENIQFTRETL